MTPLTCSSVAATHCSLVMGAELRQKTTFSHSTVPPHTTLSAPPFCAVDWHPVNAALRTTTPNGPPSGPRPLANWMFCSVATPPPESKRSCVAPPPSSVTWLLPSIVAPEGTSTGEPSEMVVGTSQENKSVLSPAESAAMPACEPVVGDSRIAAPRCLVPS